MQYGIYINQLAASKLGLDLVDAVLFDVIQKMLSCGGLTTEKCPWQTICLDCLQENYGRSATSSISYA
jgi:hypothetical protein